MGSSNIYQFEKQSRSARKMAQIPISINKEPGFTRDISASGMYIVQCRQQEIGSHIEFTVDLDTSMGKIKLHCEGEVVRIEENIGSDGRIGIGIKIIHQFGSQLMLDNLPDASAGMGRPERACCLTPEHQQQQSRRIGPQT